MIRLMFKMILWLVGGGVLLLLTSLVFLRNSGGEQAPPDVVARIDGMNMLTIQHAGAAAPAGKIMAQDGTIGDLSFFRGKLALVYLWSPETTLSAIIEFEGLAKLAAKINSPDLVIVPIAITRSGWGVVDQFTRRNPTNLPLYLDAAGPEGSLFRFFRLPTTLIIGPDGTEIGRLPGPGMWDSPRAVAVVAKILHDLRTPPEDTAEEATDAPPEPPRESLRDPMESFIPNGPQIGPYGK